MYQLITFFSLQEKKLPVRGSYYVTKLLHFLFTHIKLTASHIPNIIKLR